MSKMEAETLAESAADTNLRENSRQAQEVQLQKEQQYRKKWLDRVNAKQTGKQMSAGPLGLLGTIAMSLAYQKDCSANLVMDDNHDFEAVSSYGVKNANHGCVIVLENADLENIIATAPVVTICQPIQNSMFANGDSAPPDGAPDTAGSSTLPVRASVTESGNYSVNESVSSSQSTVKKPKPVAWTVDVPAQHPPPQLSARSTQKDRLHSARRDDAPDNGAQTRSSISELEAAARNRDKILSGLQNPVLSVPASVRDHPEETYTAGKIASREKTSTDNRTFDDQIAGKRPEPVYRPLVLPTPDHNHSVADDERSAFSSSTIQSRGSVGSRTAVDSIAKPSRREEPPNRPHELTKATANASSNGGGVTVEPLPREPELLSPTTLFESDCPLRCVVPLIELSESRAPSSSASASFSCDSVAVGSNSKSVHIVPVKSEGSSGGNTFAGVHNGSIYAMDWSYALGTLVTGSNDKTLRLIK
jgi:hypothetical protein